jgi:hypothetical protein
MGFVKQLVTPGIFDGALRKIERADQHIANLSGVLNAFLQTDFHEFSGKTDSTTGRHFLECICEPTPAEVPLILGDALHNLRTSLDFVATAITRAANEPISYSKFPFRKTREELVAAINGGLRRVAPASVISVIIDEIKPYRGGNDALYALHDMDVMDKHLLIVPTVSVATITGVTLSFGALKMYDCLVGIEAGGKFRMAAGLPGGDCPQLNVENKGKPSCSVVFLDRSMPFHMQPVIPVLHQLSQLASDAVRAMVDAYRSV